MAQSIRVLNLFGMPAEHSARLAAVSPRLDIIDIDEALLDRVDDAAAEVVFANSPPPAEGTPRLRWLQVASAGVDHMARSTLWTRGVTVTNARGVYAVAMAEYVMAAALAAAQRAEERRRLQIARQWPVYGQFVPSPVQGATMVLVGYGSVGREVARLATAFGMHVIAFKARPDLRDDESFHEPGRGDPSGILPDRIVGLEGLPDAIGVADYLVVTLPLTPSTQGLIGTELLECLKPTAWLINVSRGKVIDEASLIEVLSQGRIAGACLDVFATEPLPSDNALWSIPNVIISPHISGGGADNFGVLTDLCCENLRRYVEGETLINIVRPEWGY